MSGGWMMTKEEEKMMVLSRCGCDFCLAGVRWLFESQHSCEYGGTGAEPAGA